MAEPWQKGGCQEAWKPIFSHGGNQNALVRPTISVLEGGAGKRMRSPLEALPAGASCRPLPWLGHSRVGALWPGPCGARRHVGCDARFHAERQRRAAGALGRRRYGIDAMARLRERPGFLVHAHGFGHTFATGATKPGWNFEHLRAAMGHSDYKVFQRFRSTRDGARFGLESREGRVHRD